MHNLDTAALDCLAALADDGSFERAAQRLSITQSAVSQRLRSLEAQVGQLLVVRARPQDPTIKPWDPLGTPTWPQLAQEFHHGRDLQLLDKTHMLPMEDPALTARLIAQAIADFPD